MDNSALGARLRTIRRSQNLTQVQVAARAGIAPSFLGHLERGTRVASIATCLDLCRALNIDPNTLFDWPAAPTGDAYRLASDLLRRASELPPCP